MTRNGTHSIFNQFFSEFSIHYVRVSIFLLSLLISLPACVPAYISANSSFLVDCVASPYVHGKTQSERSALMHAALKGHADCVRLLIDFEADLDAIDCVRQKGNAHLLCVFGTRT